MRTLVIETATVACSVALAADGQVVAGAHEPGARGHAERLVPMIASLPDRGRADAILVDVGPGSFTGVRVGLAAARALALAWGVPVSGYSSLALVAARAQREGAQSLAAVLIGGHGELFVQLFGAAMTVESEILSLVPEAALTLAGDRALFGTGHAALGRGDPVEPRATDALLLPAALRGLAPRALYGRGPDATLPA